MKGGTTFLKAKEQNLVTFKGVVVRIVPLNKQNTTIVTIKVSSQKDQYDKPDVFFFADKQKYLDGISVGDQVLLQGRYQSRANKIEKTDDGKKRFSQYSQVIAAESLSPQKSIEEEAGAKEGFMYESENRVVLQGRIVSTRSYGNDRISVIIQTGNHPIRDRIAFSVFAKNGTKDVSDKFKKGDNMLVVGEVQTLPPKKGKKKIETIIARSYSVQ